MVLSKTLRFRLEILIHRIFFKFTLLLLDVFSKITGRWRGPWWSTFLFLTLSFSWNLKHRFLFIVKFSYSLVFFSLSFFSFLLLSNSTVSIFIFIFYISLNLGLSLSSFLYIRFFINLNAFRIRSPSSIYRTLRTLTDVRPIVFLVLFSFEISSVLLKFIFEEVITWLTVYIMLWLQFPDASNLRRTASRLLEFKRWRNLGLVFKRIILLILIIWKRVLRHWFRSSILMSTLLSQITSKLSIS